ncbi:MAG: phosphatidylglycerophosphatase A family protein [Gammaproteobacteria bacterium]
MTFGKNNLTNKQIMTDPVLFLAFGFGSGLAKRAPGTCGTLAAVPIYWLLSSSGTALYSIATLIVTLAGIAICGKASERLGVHDFNGIVWDEIAGYLITLWFVPFSWAAAALGFLLFRFFDIVKPWPIRWLDQKVHGGLGIMLDDVVAGLCAALILTVVMPVLAG